MKLWYSSLIMVIGLTSFGVRAQTYTRTDKITYEDNLALWVIGQQKTSTNVDTGLIESRVDYDSASELPLRTYSFEKLQQTFSYDLTSDVSTGQRGMLSTVSDGRNSASLNTTVTFSAWKRGIPQKISFPDGTSKTGVVDDVGEITSLTDENGYKTCYEYDPMGRVGKITYPSEAQLGVCDTSTWAPTTITFAGGYPSAYGVPAGQWRQTTLTGNGRKVLVLDAFWRPIVEQSLDLGNVSNTISEVINRYDPEGRLVFRSYPMSTNGQANWSDSTLTGLHTTYDALGRVQQVVQDSELGSLTTTTEYLSGFKTRVTDPRNFQTITSYLTWDQPTTDFPIAIISPEDSVTEFIRDGFGKPLAVARHNGANSTWLRRYFAYDQYQQLCKRTELETGSTFFHYDAAGNLDWSAAGLAWSPGSTCDADSATAYSSGRRVDRTYDARNRLTAIIFPDHKGDSGYHYSPDGLLTSIFNNNDGTTVTTSYGYNARRLMTGETLTWGGNVNWPISYQYDANGHLSTQYWHGLTISYAPNALGQPTQAGTYATGASYYPNGAIKQFTYGNGIVHTMTQNARKLPDTSCDSFGACGATSVLNDGYDYDANGNVAGISDGRTGQRGNRTMSYDGLDRLLTATSPMYGTTGASYSYDALDNLTHVVAPGRDQWYCYDSANRLANVKTGSCSGATVVGMGYDAQGNLVNKNGVAFGFDYGNRLRSVTQGATTSTYLYDAKGLRVLDQTNAGRKYSQYTANGQLSMTADERQWKVDEYVYLSGSLVGIRERDVPTGVYTVKYQHTDALGTPVAVTDPNRNVIQQSEYEPYGALLNRPATDGPAYTGHVADAATGMDYMQQRYYDPGIGRFLSADPVAAETTTGWNFNRYNYAANNPDKFTDPDGRCIDGGSCESMAQSFGQNPDAGRPLAPYAAAGLALLAAPIAWEGGMAVLSNPAAVATATNVAAEATGVTGSVTASASVANELPAVEGKVSTLAPGPYAGESLAARSSAQQFNAGERASINRIGSETGCHTCGATSAGTKSGNFVPDHQPVTSLNTAGSAQRLYPHCLTCSRQQGLQAARLLRKRRNN